MQTKPRLSFWQIWNMSFGFLGIQFGFALQNANVSRIFETLGAKVEDIPILWIAAPVTGLIVQPIVGYYSDRTWNRLGRRRPYFLFGAILSSLALILMPDSATLWVAAGILWMMDASINITMEPFRAFVGDNLPAEQRTRGFAMQSFFIGVGAVVASMLPWMLANWFGVSNTAAEGVVPDTVKWSFYLGALCFLGAVLWTVFRSKEYPPEDLERFEKAEGKPEYHEHRTAEALKARARKQLLIGAVLLVAGALLFRWLFFMDLEKDLFILAGGLAVSGLLLLAAASLELAGRSRNAFVQIVSDFQDMPGTMKQLAWVQFFSWFSLFAMWIYTTAAVTRHLYGATDAASPAYNEGANWVGVCFAAYNGVAALVAFLLPVLALKLGRKGTHALSLVLGALGLVSMTVVEDPTMLLVSMVGIGVAWASILSMPYAILSGALPAAKMGYYMGVFNFFIVIPQIVAASILGFLLKQFFQADPLWALVLGGASFVIAALLTMRVRELQPGGVGH